jgi:hypothetical protein
MHDGEVWVGHKMEHKSRVSEKMSCFVLLYV